MKAKIIVAALAMAFAASANATIISNQSDWTKDQLFLSVYDTTSQTSYTRGLDMTIGSLISGANINFGGTPKAAVITGSDTVANNYTLAADANFNSFMSAAAAADAKLGLASDIQWSVIGGGNNQYGYGTAGYVSTSNNMSSGWSTNKLQSMNSFNGNYIPNNVATDVGDTSSSLAAIGSNAYTLDPTSGMNNNFGGSAAGLFVNNAALDVSQSFYLMTDTQNARGQWAGAVGLFQFGNDAGTSTFTLSSIGTLSYTVAAPVAAVPEAGEGAMLAFGMALMGFVVNRRNKKQA